MNTRRSTRSSSASKDTEPENVSSGKKDEKRKTVKKTGPRITGKLSPLKSKSVKRKSKKNDQSGTKEIPPKKRKSTKLKSAEEEKSATVNEASSEEKIIPKTTAKKKKKAKVEPQRLTENDPLEKLWDEKKAAKEDGSYTFKILSWNVAGLRALLRNHPDALPNLAKTHNIDLLCLQETKLQEMHVDDPKLKIKGFLLEEEGYDSYYNCATSKKGYSGTAVFVKRRSKRSNLDEKAEDDVIKEKKKQTSMTQFFNKTSAPSSTSFEIETEGSFDTSIFTPKDVHYKMGYSKHDTEGRMITLYYKNLFTLSNLYVPNSGQKLDRLLYRTKEWDTDLVKYMDEHAQVTNHPVIWFGDLNVAHGASDTWNEGAKHLAKSAGTTKEERESFEKQLEYNVKTENDEDENKIEAYVDAFRFLHPDKGGHYTYWSQRAGNRAPNKGLRLDYFICSKSLMEDKGRVVVRDSYMIPEQMGSDHCPIVLELEVKK